MKVLVVQLCRMGDIVQTLPVLTGLASEGVEVHLVLREEFRGLPLPRAITRVHSLPAALGSGAAPAEVGVRIAELGAFLMRLAEERFDTVINLSHDPESSAITRYVGARDIRGVTLEDDRNFGVRGAWMEYLLSLPANRHLGPFNLSDVYCRVARLEHLPEPRLELPAPARERAKRLLAEGTLSEPPRVGLVPGASDARKCWSAASFAELARSLARRGVGVVLLGTKAERELSETIREDAGPGPVNLAGETSLPELAAVLASLDLVVTNDTGTMHLAALAGTTTLTLTLGPAHVHESAPFGSGHVSIQPELHCHPCDFASFCSDPVCHDVVAPESVVALALAMLSGAPLEEIDVSGCRALRTRFDERGRLRALPVRPVPARVDDVLRLVYRELWERTLGSQAPLDASDLAQELELHWERGSALALAEEVTIVGERARALAVTLETAVSELLSDLRRETTGDNKIALRLGRLSDEVDRAGRLDARIRPLTAHTLLRLQLIGSRSRAAAPTELLRCLTGAANRARTLHAIVSKLREALEASAGSPSSA